MVYPYAPNAVLIGFLFSFLGGLVGLFLLGQMKLVLILRALCRTSLPARPQASLAMPPAVAAGR